jgi:hypothetical protein
MQQKKTNSPNKATFGRFRIEMQKDSKAISFRKKPIKYKIKKG